MQSKQTPKAVLFAFFFVRRFRIFFQPTIRMCALRRRVDISASNDDWMKPKFRTKSRKYLPQWRRRRPTNKRN